MFDPVLKAIGWLLAVFYSVVPNLGIAIILLTFTIMLLLYPLTAKQARSMIAMQMVQPEIKRIQAKYKNDKAKLNEEMMAFYQENKINPLAGCLPLVIQMPIFFALFRVLRNAYKYVPAPPSQFSQLYKAFCTAKTGKVVNVSQCSGDGRYPSLPVHQHFLGIDLSVSAPSQIGMWATFAAFALVILVMLTGFLQSRQAAKRTPAVNKQMAMITKVLPVFFGFISLRFPAGLVLYFFVSNLWRLGQQEVIFRKYGSAANPKQHKSLVRPKTDVLDVESREHDEGGAVAVADEPKPPGNKPAPKAGSKPPAKAAPKPASNGGAGKAIEKSSAPAKTPKQVVPPPARGSGGLRGLFKLPPPPGELPPTGPAKSSSSKSAPSKAAAPKTAPPKTTQAKKPSSGSSSTSGARPGVDGRRTSKKKPKR